MSKRLSILLAATCLLLASARADFSFTPGNTYSTHYSSQNILQYGSDGTVVGSLTLSSTLGSETRGIAFGSNGLLYVTMVRGSGFAVVGIDSAGIAQQTYAYTPVYIAGDTGYGKIAVSGGYIYVAGGTQLTRYEIGSSAAGVALFSGSQITDVKNLPSGNLLVASAYNIREITSSGALIRDIQLGGGQSFSDVQGVEYSPFTNTIYVTQLGYTGFSFRLMRVDFATGMLLGSVDFNYGADMFLSTDGSLLVGSSYQVPRVYTQSLQQIGSLGTTARKFVTQYSVPEPSIVTLLCCGAVAVLLTAARRHRKSTLRL